MTMTAIAFCYYLAERIPDIETLLSEHVANYDEVLPHVFMGDVTRYVLEDRPNRADVVKELEAAFIDQGPEVEELIAVSFVENLVTEDELKKAIQGVDAPKLIAEWQKQQSA
jgi:hypothetical protein